MSAPASTESLVFKILSILASGLSSALAIANAVYFSQISRSELPDEQLPVSKQVGMIMMWINIVAAVLSLIFFGWALFRTIFGREARRELGRRTGEFFRQDVEGFVPALPRQAVGRRRFAPQEVEMQPMF